MLGYAVFAKIMLRLALRALEVLVVSCSNSNSGIGDVSREISDMVIEWEIFLPNVMTKKRELPFCKSCTRFAILTSSKPGTSRDENIRQFYRTILCIYSFIIQENSLALNVPPATVRLIM